MVVRWIGLINAILWGLAGIGWLLDSSALFWMTSAAALVMTVAFYPAKMLLDLESKRRDR